MNENGVKSRQDIDDKYKWRLSDIFFDEKAWEKALEDLDEPLEKLVSLKGKIGKGADNLAEALHYNEECSMQVIEIYTYAKMKKDLDNSDSASQSMYDRAVSKYFDVSAKTAFLSPEISKIQRKKLDGWKKNSECLEKYKHYLDNMIRNKKHILSEKEEKLLSGIGPFADGIEEAFSMLNNVELDFGEIMYKDGKKEKLTHAKFGSLREHPDREVRQQAYRNINSAYAGFKNTISAIYTANVKSDVFFSETRGFKSCVEKAMFADNLPVAIYEELIKSVADGLPIFHKYLKLRKKVLGLDELHIFDCSVPIVETPEKEYGFDESKEILLEGLSPLGHKYVSDVKKLFEGGWVDVYETPGKTSGAYAWGTYKSHPYMLLNWSYKMDDLFTLSHETGHCMHSYYSDRNQTYTNSHYPIYLAEIASTVNENILLRYMVGKCNDKTSEGKKEKAYLVNHFLEGVKDTVIRQTMFAEFELEVHRRIENRQPVTAESLGDLYGSLLEKYFGNDVVIDDYMKYEWARIPHFYSAFYVYKYATGFCAAAEITHKIFEKGDEAVKGYVKFLSSGGSDYPGNILDRLGVDMTKPVVVRRTMDEFEKQLETLEKLI